MLHRPDARLPLPSAITRLCVNERDPFKKNSLPSLSPSPYSYRSGGAAAASMAMNGRRMLDEREGKRGDCRNFPIRYEAPSSHAAATMAPLARKDPRSLPRFIHPPDHLTYSTWHGVPTGSPTRIPEISMDLWLDLTWLVVITPNFKVSLKLI